MILPSFRCRSLCLLPRTISRNSIVGHSRHVSSKSTRIMRLVTDATWTKVFLPCELLGRINTDNASVVEHGKVNKRKGERDRTDQEAVCSVICC
jgi:hypothetical protein